VRLFKRLRRKIGYLDDKQIEQVHQAYLVALDAHRGQKRRTGEPYITHPVAVTCILADMKMDHQSLMAALLHDVIEDTAVEKADLAAKFGETVADLVDGVSKLTQIEFVSRAQAQAENFRKMVLAMAKDIRVIIIKLADRLHNMRTLGSLAPVKRLRIAKETLEIFAPIAKRLGMRDLSVELEELGFMSQYPRRYAILKEEVRRARGHRKKVLNLIDKALQEGLSKSSLPTCSVTGREKHLYSIYRKMCSKKIPFNEIMDVYAFRIIVDSVDSCYRALGLVHGLFKPVPERFKDYIAIPKANGYQSLHTTLFGPYGLPIEVQIRTAEMDRMATSGIAAHWLYKSGQEDINKTQLRAQKWVKNLLELQQSSGNSLEFIESVKMDLFPDEVYVFTPQGDIMGLPAGASPVDFAYAVHTDIGNSCVGVKIDRKLAPLSAILSNGQTVEIITTPRSRPNPAWLDFVVTSKARNSIRHFLKNQRHDESVSLGKQLLQKALESIDISLKKIPQEAVDRLLSETHLQSMDDLLAEVGLGDRIATLVAQRLHNLSKMDLEEQPKLTTDEQAEPLVIKGTESMVVNFATCCCPIPGDPIVGVLYAGEGLVVHYDKCQRINKLRRHPDRIISLRWAKDVKQDFVVFLSVKVLNQRGVLAVMAIAVSDADSNIEDINVSDRDGQHYVVNFKLLVKDRLHLARVLRNLRHLPVVVRITRKR
jgi:GTP diphosphokinase / guanosine-3',5'-bis(diphosphate) 3'-diphosphatase